MPDPVKAWVMKRLEEGASEEDIAAEFPAFKAQSLQGGISGPDVDAVSGAGAPTPAPGQPSPSPTRPRGMDSPQTEGPGMLASLGRGIGDAASWAAEVGRAARSELAGGRTLGFFGAEQSARRAPYIRPEAVRDGLISPSAYRQATGDREAAQQDYDAVKKHPLVGVGADLVGGFSGVGAGVSRNISRVPVKPAAGLRGKLGFSSGAEHARDAIGGAAGGFVEGAGRSILEGDSAGDAVDKGGLAGIAGALLGPIFRASGDYLRDPRGLTGKQIQALKQGAGYIGSEGFQQLDEGLAGVGQLATTEGRALGEGQASKFAAATERINAAENAIPGIDVPTEVGPTHRRLDQAVDRFSQGRAVRPDIEAAIGHINVPDQPPTGIKADLSRDAPLFRMVPPSPPPSAPEPGPPSWTSDLVHQRNRPGPMKVGVGDKRVFYGTDPSPISHPPPARGLIADPLDAAKPPRSDPRINTRIAGEGDGMFSIDAVGPDGNVIGSVDVSLDPMGRPFVSSASVGDAFQRQGYASALYEQASAMARKKWGAPLHSGWSNNEAGAFWRKAEERGRARQITDEPIPGADPDKPLYQWQPGRGLPPQGDPQYTPPPKPAAAAKTAPPPIEMEQAGTTRVTQATPRDLVKSRRKVRALAEHGMPSTPQNAPYREIYGDLADATHSPDLPMEIGKKLMAADKQFASDMEFLAEGNARIFGKEDARAVTDSVAAGRAASQKLSRAIGDTHAAGMRSVELDELAALGPEYADAINRIKTKIAYEGTRAGFPRIFSHSGSWTLQPLIANLNALKARGVEPLTRTPALPSQIGYHAADLFDASRDNAAAKRSKRQTKETRP